MRRDEASPTLGDFCAGRMHGALAVAACSLPSLFQRVDVPGALKGDHRLSLVHKITLSIGEDDVVAERADCVSEAAGASDEYAFGMPYGGIVGRGEHSGLR